MYYPDPAFDQYTVQQQQQHHHMFHQPHHIMQPHYIQELQLEPLQPIPQPRQVQVSHPYARLFAKKDQVKRRKIWNHALEKSLFNPFELSTVGAPHRRTIYIASLEAHVDRLHDQLLELGFCLVAFDTNSDPFKGLHCKTAKSMVAGLQHDASVSKLKLLELERANADLAKFLSNLPEET